MCVCDAIAEHTLSWTVPGVMGTLQAMEAIKIVAGLGSSYSQRLLVFDGAAGMFRAVKLRPRQADCAVCSDQRTICDVAGVDYDQFCGRGPNDKVSSLYSKNEFDSHAHKRRSS